MKVISGLGLGVVLDCHALVARERADHDLDLVLLERPFSSSSTALSGVASDQTLTNSIFLPPAMPLLFLERHVGAAGSRPGLAPANGPSRVGQQADLERLLRLRAEPIKAAAAAAPMAVRIQSPLRCSPLWVPLPGGKSVAV